MNNDQAISRECEAFNITRTQANRKIKQRMELERRGYTRSRNFMKDG